MTDDEAEKPYLDKSPSAGRVGKAIEYLVAASCILVTRGELNMSTSLVDDEGVDLVFHRRGSTATLAVQVKGRTSSSKRVASGGFVAFVRSQTFQPRADLDMLFVAVDSNTAAICTTGWCRAWSTPQLWRSRTAVAATGSVRQPSRSVPTAGVPTGWPPLSCRCASWTDSPSWRPRRDRSVSPAGGPVRGDEARVVAAFCEHLRTEGWVVYTEVKFCDVLAERDGRRIYAKDLDASRGTLAGGMGVGADATLVPSTSRVPTPVSAKGRTSSPGLDVDAMFGQLLRRMPEDDDPAGRYAVVVPVEARAAVLRVPARVREQLRIDVFTVDSDGLVSVL